MSISANKIAEVLGGVRSLGKRVLTMRDLEMVVADGLPKSALDTLVDGLGRHFPERSANDMCFRVSGHSRPF